VSKAGKPEERGCWVDPLGLKLLRRRLPRRASLLSLRYIYRYVCALLPLPGPTPYFKLRMSWLAPARLAALRWSREARRPLTRTTRCELGPGERAVTEVMVDRVPSSTTSRFAA
jgi:hypothetical protein